MPTRRNKSSSSSSSSSTDEVLELLPKEPMESCCPHCDSRKGSRVLKTMKFRFGIIRHRMCLGCAKRFETEESFKIRE